jgi:hypothetical protein
MGNSTHVQGNAQRSVSPLVGDRAQSSFRAKRSGHNRRESSDTLVVEGGWGEGGIVKTMNVTTTHSQDDLSKVSNRS